MTLRQIISRFRWQVAATVTLVLVEAVVVLLFPLFIGLAINDLLDDSYRGVAMLGGLGVTALAVGSGRRYFDTRAYTGIYEAIATELVAREHERDTETSKIAARTTLAGEFVEFLENSMPEIVTASIGTVGMLAILAGLDLNVFFACLGLLGLLVVTYWASARRNLALNKGYNDELERQVTAIDSRQNEVISGHFRALMRWNRQLSDLETLNYVVIWLGVIALLVYAPIEVIGPEGADYGFAFSTILYVFQYVDALIALPLFVQQIIRLKEISTRLTADEVVAV